MKTRIIVLLCCMSFSIMASAQASGGQIRRNVQRTTSKVNRSFSPSRNRTTSKVNRSVSPSINTSRTYTTREMFEMGNSFYDKGNYTEALNWYKKAAENGYSDAQSELGFMYLNGEGVTVNKPEAVKWLRKAGENGDALAQQAVGYMYKNGDGVPKNLSEAQKWFRMAAPKFYDLSKKLMNSGNKQCVDFFETLIDMDILPYNVFSIFHLGAIYYYGEGGQNTDFSKSFRYFTLAAEKDNKPAWYYLGLCYEYGRGTPKDMKKAKECYQKSGYSSLPRRDF